LERDEAAIREAESLKKLLQEHEQGMSTVSRQYAQLQAEHEETLKMVDNLKKEVENSRNAPSPTAPTPGQKVIRRMTSQNMTTVDRAHRSLSSLRTLAGEALGNEPDTLQNFEVHLTAAMHELQSRMERIQSLEMENQNVKREMDMKSTIISGLTRERSSLKGPSAIDMSVVSQLRNQIEKYERQMRDSQESHDAREDELRTELLALNDILEEYKTTLEAREAEIKSQKETIDMLRVNQNVSSATLQSTQSKLQSALADLDVARTERAELQQKHEAALAQLEAASIERAEWQSKHQAATQSLQSSEKQLQSTLAELNSTLASLDAIRTERKETDDSSAFAASEALDRERAAHQTLVSTLQQEIENQKITVATQLGAIADLERQCAEAKSTLDTASSDATAVDSQKFAAYASRVQELTTELEAYRSTVELQKSELSLLQSSHEDALKELEERMAADAEVQLEARLAEEAAQHEQVLNELRAEITKSKTELTQLLDTITAMLNTPVTLATIQDQLEDILSQKQRFADKYAELIDTNEELIKRLDTTEGTREKLEKQVGELAQQSEQTEAKINELAHLVANHEDALKAKEELIKKKEATLLEVTVEKDKSLRLVEELEEQITNTFDQHHNRLSVIQQERNQALDDAKIKIAQYEKDIEAYRAQISQFEVCFIFRRAS
jgi:kinesin family protein 4/21/27